MLSACLLLKVMKILNLAKSRFSKEGRGGPFELLPSSEILKGERDGRHEVAPASWKTGTQRDRETERERERETMAVAGGGLAKRLAKGDPKKN